MGPAWQMLTGTETLGLNLAGTKSFQALSKERFVRFAEKGGFPAELIVAAAQESTR